MKGMIKQEVKRNAWLFWFKIAASNSYDAGCNKPIIFSR